MSKQIYTIDEVKKWFSPLVLNTNTSHLTSLGNYGNNPVNSTDKNSPTAWHRLFNECLMDINVPDEYYKHYIAEFEKKCGKSISELNAMTKKYFVILFAKTMDDIFTEEERQEEEEEEKKRQEKERKEKERQAAIQKSREEANRPKKLDDDGCEVGKEYFNTYENKCLNIGDRGGSKKKSNKRIRRKRRDSRRNKTRKYKKRN